MLCYGTEDKRGSFLIEPLIEKERERGREGGRERKEVKRDREGNRVKETNNHCGF